MNYHIMIDIKFGDVFIDDAEKASSPGKNRYFIRGNKEHAIFVKHLKAEWIDDVYGDEFRNILNSITEYDKLFVHWYDLYIGKFLLTIDINIRLYVPLTGGDFYGEPLLYHKNWLFDHYTLAYVNRIYLYPIIWAKKPHVLLKQLFAVISKKKSTKKEFDLKKQTIQRINYILIHPDNSAEVELIKRIYKINELAFLPFYNNHSLDFTTQSEIISKKTEGIITIQIGNSETETNNHVDLFKVLQKFNKQDIKILLPLSYGYPKYKDFVKQKCKNIFGFKAEYIEDFMPKEEYIKKLKEVDVCIMYHNRSQALGNCIALLALGKKLYLKKNNPLWILFKKISVLVFDANTIKNITFQEFREPLSDEQIQSNIERISVHFSDEIGLKYLTTVLS